jgi:hypothetical protein
MPAPEPTRYLTADGDMVEVYYSPTDAGWRWRRRAANRRVIADGSEGYSRRDSALRAARRSCPPVATADPVAPPQQPTPVATDSDVHGQWSP